MGDSIKTLQDFNLEVLAKFPHVVKNLSTMWGDPQCLVYIQSLLTVDPKRTHRQGFPFETAIEIQKIKDYYEANLFKICDHLNAHQQFKVNKEILHADDAWKGRG